MPAINFSKISKGINLPPIAAPSSPSNGDLYYDSTANRFKGYMNGAFSSIPGIDTTDTLTNKTISGASNTLSSIADGSLSTSYLKADGSRPLTGDWGAGNFRVQIGASSGASGYLYVGNQSASAGILTTTNQQGIAIDYTVSSSATVGAQGIDSFVRVANASFTCPVVSNFKADTITKGASATITRSIQYELSGTLSVASNNAGIADNETFSGDWFINAVSTKPNQLYGTTGIAGDRNSGHQLIVGLGSSGANASGSDQSCISAWQTSTSGATNSVVGFNSNITTATASFTTTYRAQYQSQNPAKGVGSTITRDIGFYFLGLPTQGTNNAAIADNTSFSGSFFINSTSSNTSLLGGTLQINGSAFATSQIIRATSGSTTGMSQASQFGIYSDASFGANATTEAHAYFAQVQTTNSSFTTPIATAYKAGTSAKGASNTITRLVNFYGDNQTDGTNNAWAADNASFTGQFVLNFTSTRASKFGGSVEITGVTDGSAAAAGKVSEVISSAVGSTNAGTTNQYKDLTSISLTAGRWLVSSSGEGVLNGATVTEMDTGISLTAGNSATGMTNGDNFNGVIIPSSTTNSGFCIPNYVVNVSTTTTVYLKIYAVYSAGTPQFRGRLTAVRMA